MADLLSILLGISFASGLNLYATVLGLGLLDRFGVLDLPGKLDAVSSVPVILGAAVMFGVEFVADKVPYFDTVWDTLHSLIRPAGGALLAYSAAADLSLEWQILGALAGGSVALTSHAAKTSTRAAVNVSPEPVSNWILSITEDVAAFSLVWFSVAYPFIAIAIVIVLLLASIILIIKLSRLLRRIRRTAA